MIDYPRNIAKINAPRNRIAENILALVLACLMGTVAWLTVIVFLVFGATLLSVLDIGAPDWVGWLALLGLPLGAWIEVRFSQ